MKEMKQYNTKLLVIGSGPAGATACIYGARANLNPILVQGLVPGGQLTITTEVENYPGFAQSIMGPYLMEQMIKQAHNVGTEIISDHIISLIQDKDKFIAKGMSNASYIADSIIISTGAEAKWLGIPSESKYQGFGVSGCATCDGFFFKNKNVIVVGGGNTAVEEAIYLTNHANKVTLIHRRDSLRAEKILQDRMFRNPKIEIIWNSVLEEIIGTDDPKSVTGVIIKNINNEQISEISVEGVFVAIGHKPKTELFKGLLKMDEEGYIITKPDSTQTNIPGIFAAGDVQDKIYRQAVTAAGTGCMAALEAMKYLSEKE
jgi:thioredoxin reductase (NADPH)